MGKLRQTQTASDYTAALPAGAGRRGKPSPPSVQDRTAAVARGVTVVLEHHDCPSHLIRDCLNQMAEVLNTAEDERVWVKRLKNLLARPLAQYLRNELPPDSDKIFKPQGAFRRWFRNRLNAFNDKNTHLWYSWFQMKRCCLPSSEDFIAHTYKEHKESLTSPDPGDDDLIDMVFDNPVFLDVLEHIRGEIPPYMNLKSSDLRSTQSACFENTRQFGGQFKYLKNLSGITDNFFGFFTDNGYGDYKAHPILDQDEYYHTSFTTNLKKMEFFHRTLLDTNVVRTTREPYGREDWSSLDVYEKEPKLWPDNLRCEIKGVIEPLKIRVISKGEGLNYYSQRKIQRALHDTIRRMPCFRLVGRPFSPTDLMDLKNVSKETDHWFSVDYSAATDGLSWKFSSRILTYLLQDFPFELSQALKVLGPHDLYYPQLRKGKWCAAEYEATQVNGQLMGSILSFPILCLANLATYLLTNEEDHMTRGLSTEQVLQGVLINGDDMVYAADPSLWSRHVEISSKLGLKMSVGKAYVHPRYANINSTSVVFDLSKDGTPREIPYLNVGLFFQSPVQKKETEDKKIARKERDLLRQQSGMAKSHHEEEGIVACINELKRGSLTDNKFIGLLRKYISTNTSTINDETLSYLIINGKKVLYHRNLFTPISVGGMGIERPVGWNTQYKEIERVLAGNLMSRFPLALDSARPLRGFELRGEVPADSPWVKPQRLPDPPEFVLENMKWKSKRSILRTGFFVPVPNPSIRMVPSDAPFVPFLTEPLPLFEELEPLPEIRHTSTAALAHTQALEIRWEDFVSEVRNPLLKGIVTSIDGCVLERR